MINYLISVIIPIYNVEEYLGQCIESVLNQSYNKLEIILVDDGSTDRSGIICDDFKAIDNRIVVIHKQNGGAASARNMGLSVAKGEYIGFVDSDDYVDKNFFERLFLAARVNDADMSCMDYKEVYEDGEEYKEGIKDIIILKNKDFLMEIAKPESDLNITFCMWTKLFKRSLLENIQFPDGMNYEEIVPITKAVMKANRCVFVKEKRYFYRLRNGSITRSEKDRGFDPKLLNDRLSLQMEQLILLEDEEETDLKNAFRAYYYEDILQYLKKNITKEEKEHILWALNTWKLSIKEIRGLKFSRNRKLKIWIKMRMAYVKHLG